MVAEAYRGSDLLQSLFIELQVLEELHLLEYVFDFCQVSLSSLLSLLHKHFQLTFHMDGESVVTDEFFRIYGCQLLR